MKLRSTPETTKENSNALTWLKWVTTSLFAIFALNQPANAQSYTIDNLPICKTHKKWVAIDCINGAVIANWAELSTTSCECDWDKVIFHDTAKGLARKWIKKATPKVKKWLQKFKEWLNN